MKFLIWFAVLFVFSAIQVLLGIQLGAIPYMIFYGTAFAIAKALCKSVDKKRMVSNPDKYLKTPAEPQRKVLDREWACPVCGCVNRHLDYTCNECGMEKTVAHEWLQKYLEKEKKISAGKPIAREPRPGDWVCPKCGNVHDKEIVRCWKCGTMKKSAAAYQKSAVQKTEQNSSITTSSSALTNSNNVSANNMLSQPPLQQASLTFRDLNSNAVYTVALESGLFVVIGREQTAAIYLSDPTAAKIHCLLGLSGGKIYVKHMESINGTLFQRGMEVIQIEDIAEIQEGDILILSGVYLMLESIA